MLAFLPAPIIDAPSGGIVGAMPRAPEVEIRAPSILFVGRPIEIAVDITARDATKIEFVDAKITGTQGWRVGFGKSAVTHRVEYPRLVARLVEEGVLPEGVTRLSTRLTLPPDMPPSHELAPAYAFLELLIHVSIPWWPDGRYRYRLPVRVPPPPSVVRTPIAVRSTKDADKPRIEVSLASARLVAGEVLVGSVALFHLDDKRPRDVELSLVPELALYGGYGVRERSAASCRWTLTTPAGSAGTSVPFRLSLPPTIPPSFQAVSQQLRWLLVASSGSLFSGKVEIAVPLEVVDAHASATTAPMQSAPLLADERTTAVFARFAATRGWPAPEDAGHGPAVHREVGDHQLSLAHAYRGEDGTFIVATIETPSLGLRLSVTPAKGLRQVFFHDVEIDIADFDRAHHVTARSADQVIPILRAVAPVLATATAKLGRFVRWTDDGIEFERQVTSVEEADLGMMATGLLELGAAIGVAASEVAPPADVDVDLYAWRALARHLHGKESLGDLSIHGRIDALPVSLGLEWDADDRPLAIRVHVGDPTLASDATRSLALTIASPSTDSAPGLGDNLDATARIRAFPADIVRLDIADGIASASWVIPSPARVDATRVRELVEALHALLGALDTTRTPYR